MTKKMRAAILELLEAAKKFTPNDETIKIYDELASLGQARQYGKTCNLEPFTDTQAVRLRNAVDEVKKLM
jgi:hypothetical protein